MPTGSSLPDEQRICTPDTPGFASRLDTDEFVFITHSLGSRITTDGLQRLTQVVEAEGRSRPEVARVSQSFQERGVKVFMLANQLPLLQSGLEPASVQGAVPAYCRPDGAEFANRVFKETELIAFSDPNDLLSYPIPDAFVRDHVDSRLCPKQVNVTINIAQVRSVLGLGRVRQPACRAQRLRRRRAGDRLDHPRHRPAGDRGGGGGALHLARGRRGPALTRAPDQLASPMPRRIASCFKGGSRSIAAKPRPRTSLAAARSVENSRFRPSVRPTVSQRIGAAQTIVAQQGVGAARVDAGAHALDHHLGQRGDVAHGEVEALGMDRMQAMRGIAHQRHAWRTVARRLQAAQGMAGRLAAKARSLEVDLDAVLQLEQQAFGLQTQQLLRDGAGLDPGDRA